MPRPFVADPLYTPDEQAKTRAEVQGLRDAVFFSTAAARITRLQRVLDTLPLRLTEQQQRGLDLRIQLITFALLDAEFSLTKESAPNAAAEVERIRRQLALQPPGVPPPTALATADLRKLIERFEVDVAKIPTAQEKYDNLRRRVDAVDIGLSVEMFRDPVIEATLGAHAAVLSSSEDHP